VALYTQTKHRTQTCSQNNIVRNIIYNKGENANILSYITTNFTYCRPRKIIHRNV